MKFLVLKPPDEHFNGSRLFVLMFSPRRIIVFAQTKPLDSSRRSPADYEVNVEMSACPRKQQRLFPRRSPWFAICSGDESCGF